MTDYAIWKPEHDGHAPPNWREGMKWTRPTMPSVFNESGHPEWVGGYEYRVPAEALNSPNDDASGDVDTWKRDDAMAKWKAADAADIARMAESLRQYPAEELAKHGITLAPEKDWATELWAELFTIRGMTGFAKSIREGRIDDDDRAAIELLRTRIEQMKGEG